MDLYFNSVLLSAMLMLFGVLLAKNALQRRSDLFDLAMEHADQGNPRAYLVIFIPILNIIMPCLLIWLFSSDKNIDYFIKITEELEDDNNEN